jgi:flagellar motility protein MotE (MotC chaperone)
MDFAHLEALRRTHPAWRLLAADQAPLVAGFLYRAFVEPNVRSVPQHDLALRLDDYLHRVREELGDEAAFPRLALQYLEIWASGEHAWLRKYYAPGNDEPWFDITPATEKAIVWLAELEQRQFVGTESRLNTVFDLLRQIVHGTELNTEVRLAELMKQRAALDAEIESVRQGRVEIMDATQVKDRFQQMAATARGLLTDFREVEQNFRDLDRAVRERIATWEGGKGELLGEIFGERDAISESDQGRSFRAFWDLLMSPARQEELSELLERVFELEPVQGLEPDRRLLRVHYDWLEAGEVAQRTVARVSEQFRRYLDDQAWLENRRIVQLIRGIEQHALALRDDAPADPVTELEASAPSVQLMLERPLFKRAEPPRLSSDGVVEGEADFAADALFEQVYVDKARLASHIRKALATRSQVSLAELLDERPLEQGLAELVAYLGLAADDQRALIDDSRPQTVVWDDPDRGQRRATLPLVVFTR